MFPEVVFSRKYLFTHLKIKKNITTNSIFKEILVANLAFKLIFRHAVATGLSKMPVQVVLSSKFPVAEFAGDGFINGVGVHVGNEFFLASKERLALNASPIFAFKMLDAHVPVQAVL